MTVHLHHLTGCAPRPLAHYLKAIGVLRLVAQQADVEARGFWRDEHFCVVTTLDRQQLEAFFLDRYEPTPFLSPWNKGSGFYQSDDPGLGAVEKSVAARFAPFRNGIAAARRPMAAIQAADALVREIKDRTKAKKGMSVAEKTRAASLKDDPAFKAELAAAEREFKRLKGDLYGPFARDWRGGEREWLDAAMVLPDDGKPSWAWLLGTGGNDGRLDFTNNAMLRLGELFDLSDAVAGSRPSAPVLLRAAFWGDASLGVSNAAVGQFLPGAAGGANSSSDGPDGSAFVNPWDFVLMLEGAIAFRGQVSRTLRATGAAYGAIPFAVHSHPVGHATPGNEEAQRGEQWLPIWHAPSTWHGVRTLLGEGRAQVRRQQATRPIDFARAIARLGTARGLSGFERYGYLERNGQSTIAVPLGRIDVGERPYARLIDDVAPWLDRLQRAARDIHAPARLRAVEKRSGDAAFAALTAPNAADRWQAVLRALADVEQVQASGTAFTVGPCPALSAEWLDAAADDSPEWRLAVAFGSAAAEYRKGRAVDSVRAHWLPLDGARYATTGDQSQKRLLKDPRVVAAGRDPIADLIAIVERRAIEATKDARRELRLVSPRGLGVRASDIAAFLDGRVDLERMTGLARGLMAVRWRDVRGLRPSVGNLEISEAWQAIRLCGLPYPVGDRRIPMEPSIVRRLASGDASGAVTLALQRLRASGFRPPLVAATTEPETARRWAAALAFPIDPALADAMAKRFSNPATTETP
jgi:CRISPR-associated protein Csx17